VLHPFKGARRRRVGHCQCDVFVHAAMAMLARDEAEALTGQTLTADGGLVMR